MDINMLSGVLLAARCKRLSEPKIYCLTDIATAFSVNPASDRLKKETAALPAHLWGMHTFYGDGGEEELPGITLEGLAVLLSSTSLIPLRQASSSLLLGVLQEASRAMGKAARVRREGDTVWGIQPIRGVLRSYNLSVRELVELLNGVPGREPGALTLPAVSATMQGRQLPSPQFYVRALHVFQCSPNKLFTQDVMRAYKKKYRGSSEQSEVSQSLGPVTIVPSDPPTLPPYAPYKLRALPPEDAPMSEESPEDLQFDPADNFEAWAAEQARLMDAAAAEAIGMPGMSFEAGFNTIMGQTASDPSTPSDQDLCGND